VGLLQRRDARDDGLTFQGKRAVSVDKDLFH
jgi:hypothetical protein